MDGARPFVVALHAGALAAQHRAGQRIAAAAVAAGEAVAGGQHHRGAAPARLGALGVGDALDGAGGILGLGGERQQRLGRRRPALVVEIEVGPAACASSSSGAMPHTGSSGTARAMSTARSASVRSAVGREVGRGDEGLALARRTRAAEIAALAALELLALAQALGDRDRLAVDIERVGGIGAGGLRPFHQVGEQVGVERAGRCGRLARGSLFAVPALLRVWPLAPFMTLLAARRPARMLRVSMPSTADGAFARGSTAGAACRVSVPHEARHRAGSRWAGPRAQAIDALGCDVAPGRARRADGRLPVAVEGSLGTSGVLARRRGRAESTRAGGRMQVVTGRCARPHRDVAEDVRDRLRTPRLAALASRPSTAVGGRRHALSEAVTMFDPCRRPTGRARPFQPR